MLGHTVAEMSNDEATLGSYGASDFYTIHCVDANWVHGADFNLGDVQKYEISEADYDKRTNTVRKYKAQMLANNPKLRQEMEEKKEF